MGLPAKTDQADPLRFFGNHLVVLCFEIQDSHCPDERIFRHYTGTLIQIEEIFAWLTSGHILSEISEFRRSTRFTIIEATLADTFGTKAICDYPVPFDLKNANILSIDDESLGLDFGLMSLRPYFVDQLLRNGIVPLKEPNWIHQQRLEFDRFFMIGFPDELATKKVVNGYGAVTPFMIHVYKVDEVPKTVRTTEHSRFVGRLPTNFGLTSLSGMSGGPIIGLRIDGEQIRYWIVAIQSSWARDERLVFGCPLPTLTSYIHKLRQ